MNTKYLVIGTLIVIIGLFLAMHQSNKNSAEKREQEMIAYQQKMERERGEFPKRGLGARRRLGRRA